jgi:ABC-type transport system substrate-binding protein
MWRRVGVEVAESVIPITLVRDREYRQAFPTFEVTARGNQDGLLTRLECSLSPTAQNRFSGSNRGHWCSDEFDRLTDLYRATLREEARGPIIRQLQDIMLEEMPIHLLNYEVSLVVARRGVTAYSDDVWGGDTGRSYGTHSRNAHEWDIVS